MFIGYNFKIANTTATCKIQTNIVEPFKQGTEEGEEEVSVSFSQCDLHRTPIGRALTLQSALVNPYF